MVSSLTIEGNLQKWLKNITLLLKDIKKCNFFTLQKKTLSSVTEQELIYVLLLDSKGTPYVNK